MDWVFIDDNTLRDKDSGYIIELISGTWDNPREIKPRSPKQSKFLRQAELLRLGLAFAHDNMLESTGT